MTAELTGPETSGSLPPLCPTHGPDMLGMERAQQDFQAMLIAGYDLDDIGAMIQPEDTHLARMHQSLTGSMRAINTLIDPNTANAEGEGNLKQQVISLLVRPRSTEITPFANELSNRFLAELGRPLTMYDALTFPHLVQTSLIDGLRIDPDAKVKSHIRSIAVQAGNQALAYTDPETLCSGQGVNLLDPKTVDDAALKLREASSKYNAQLAEIGLSPATISQHETIELSRKIQVQRDAMIRWRKQVLANEQTEESAAIDVPALQQTSAQLMGQLQRLRQFPLPTKRHSLDMAMLKDDIVFHPYRSIITGDDANGGTQPLAVVRFISHDAPTEATDLDQQTQIMESAGTQKSVILQKTNHLITLDANGDLWLGPSPDKNAISLKLVHELADRSPEYEVLRAKILQRLFDTYVPTDILEVIEAGETSSLLEATKARTAYLAGHNMKTLRSALIPQEVRRQARRSRIPAQIGPKAVAEAVNAAAEESSDDAEVFELPSLETAELALELGKLLDQDAYKIPFEMDNSASPFFATIRYQLLGVKIDHAERGIAMIYDNTEIGKRLGDNGESLVLRALQEFHSTIAGLAKFNGTSLEVFASSVNQWDTGKFLKACANDFGVLCHDGLVNSEKHHQGFMLAAKALKAINLILLMSEKGDDIQWIGELYGGILNATRINNQQGLETLANQYAVELRKPQTDGVLLQSLREQAGTHTTQMVERAAQLSLLAESYDLFVGLKDRKAARRQYMDAIHAMASMDFEALQKRVTSVIDQLESRGVKPEAVDDIIEATQLNWEVLPPGDLEGHARTIVEGLQSAGAKVEIDLERLVALEKIRNAWGKDRCYYAKGKLGKRGIIRSNGQEEPDKYLVLVMQQLDGGGNVIAEHAVAESPITGKHAMYLFRQDVSVGHTWRKVLALPKKNYAQALGARPIKHMPLKPGSNLGIPTAMAEKVRLLMDCPADVFTTAVFDGERGLRIKRSGSGASQAV